MADQSVASPNFAVLGPLEVHGGNGPVALGGPKERRLLAVLLARAGEVVSVDALVEGLWNENAPRSAAKTLQAYVVRLRKSLEPWAGLVTQAPGYRLAIARDQVDALRFTDLTIEARRALDHGDAREADRLVGRALGLCRGAPYVEFADAAFAEAEVGRLGEVRLTALEISNDAGLAFGRHAELVPALEALCAAHPLRERFWGQLVLALYRCGRQAEALAAYRRARDALIDEVGVEPGPELRRLERQVLEQDPALDPPVPLRAPLPAALEPGDRELIGRAAELEWLRAAWGQTGAGSSRWCVLSGPPGSGRTRLAAEVAAEAHAAGAEVVYAGPRTALDSVVATGRAVLVLDDLDRRVAPPDLTALVDAVSSWLVIAIYDPERASTSLRAELLRTLHSERRLEPLTGDAVAQVVSRYTDDVDPGLVERVVVESGGWPAAVHEVAAELVETSAAERVSEAGGRAVWARRELAVVRSDVRAGVRAVTRARRARSVGDDGRDDGAVVCPYKGLARYDESDAALFFGREALVTTLCARLVDTPFLAVVGPSGSGKSSLVRAGLLPALANGVVPGLDRPRRVVITPGMHPAAALRAAVPDDEPVVLVVDQFEELFTTCSDAEERAEFLAALDSMEEEDVGRVVVTLRADFVGACAEYRQLARRLEESTVLVGPMTDNEVRRVVEQPARHVGLAVDPELTDSVVADITGQPAALPLLSTALVEAWERRADRTLTAIGYLRTGGLTGAIARVAESAYCKLDDPARAAARRILVRLADVGESGVPIRRRVPRDELAADAATEQAFATFVERRLVTATEAGVEVTHEALLTAWPRLTHWLADDAQGRTLRRHIAPAAREWAAADRPDAELYRGPRLATALDWARDHGEDLNQAEQAFLDAARALSERELTEQRNRADREARGRRRLRFVLAGIVALLVVAVAASAVAVQQRSAARDAERTAESRRLGARSLIETDLDRALLLAVQAVRTDRSLTTEGDLLAVLARSPNALGQVRGDGDRLLDVALAAGGTRLVAGDNNGTITQWDPQTLRPIGGPLQIGEWAGFLTVAPDSRRAAVDTGGTLEIWDLEAWRRLHTLGDVPELSDIAWSSDGRYLAAAPGMFGDGRLRIYDTRSGRLAHQVKLGGEAFVRAAGGSFAVALAGQRRLLHVDPTSERVTRKITTPAPLWVIAASPDGKHLASGAEDGTLLLVDLPTGNVRAKVNAHNASIQSVEFTPDGSRVVTTSDDRGVAVWDATTGEKRLDLQGHTGRVTSSAISRDSNTLYTVSLDGSVIAWDIGGDRAFGVRRGGLAKRSDGLIDAYSGWSADARVAVFAEPDEIRLIDTATGRQRARFGNPEPEFFDMEFAPDGRTIFLTGGHGVTKIDARTGRKIATSHPAPGRQINDIGISADGRRIVVTSIRDHRDAPADEGPAFVLDTQTLRPIGQKVSVGFTANSPSLSQDGRFAAFGGRDVGKVLLVDLRTGKRRWAGETSGTRTSMTAFSPDSNRVVVGDINGKISLFDVASGRRISGPTVAHPGFILRVGYRPDGRVIFTSGSDGTVVLWDAKSLRRIGRPLVAADNQWAYAAYSADGKRLIAVDDQLRTVTWSASADDWLTRACAIVGRRFTKAEFVEYEIDPSAPPPCR